MNFDVTLGARQSDCLAIEAAIFPIDASAVIDLAPDGDRMRVSTLLDATQLVALLHKIGYAVKHDDVRQQPSICCGGCSG